MGLLDRWTKKKTAEKLRQLDGRSVKSVAPASAAAGNSDSKGRAEIHSDGTPKTTAGELGNRVLLHPLVTEKSAVAQSGNKYSFVVANWATKKQVKLAVQEIYGVRPIAVNVINTNGKTLRFGRNFGRRGDCRKAIITLPPGKSIILHEGV